MNLYLISYSIQESRRKSEKGGLIIRCQTDIIDFPKNDDSMASVETVKLCCPLNQRVISLGRLPNCSANCFFERPRSCMSESILLDIAKDKLISSFISGGT